MSEASEKPRPFDVRTIEHLVRLMSENDLSEIDLHEGEHRIGAAEFCEAALLGRVVHGGQASRRPTGGRHCRARELINERLCVAGCPGISRRAEDQRSQPAR